MKKLVFLAAVAAACAVAPQVARLGPVHAQSAEAVRLPQNPLLTVNSSPTIGTNINGPTVIRVPDWVARPLGRYYMYFANHKGDFIRLAYADAPTGPWKIHEPGVQHVRDTAFYRPQPDPPANTEVYYTHLASPEIFVDAANTRIVMWTHGWWTNGEAFPPGLDEVRAFVKQKGYGQYTQAAVSTDGLRFQSQPGLTRNSYLRVFQHGGVFYGLSRLGLLARAGADPLAAFEMGPSPFGDGPYANRVRHVALVPRGNQLLVYFSAIGEAPEAILRTTIDLTGDWTTWRASPAVEVMRPDAPYECIDRPIAKSAVGDAEGPERQLRDPFVFQEGGRALLYYSTCGEQGLAAATLTLPAVR